MKKKLTAFLVYIVNTNNLQSKKKSFLSVSLQDENFYEDLFVIMENYGLVSAIKKHKSKKKAHYTFYVTRFVINKVHFLNKSMQIYSNHKNLKRVNRCIGVNSIVVGFSGNRVYCSKCAYDLKVPLTLFAMLLTVDYG